MDTNDRFAKICSEGIQAEAQNRIDDALILFGEAWTVAKDDYDACVAAHFLARHQKNYQEMLRWNQEALARADMVGDERVRSFYPSLYLNLGFSHEMLGNPAEASMCYALAAEKVDGLPEGPYGDLVRHGIAEGRKRVGATGDRISGDRRQ